MTNSERKKLVLRFNNVFARLQYKINFNINNTSSFLLATDLLRDSSKRRLFKIAATNVEKMFLDLLNEEKQIEHIKGKILLGETSILIAVACKHRNQAYELSRFFIEEIKKKTSIWKKEHYKNEDSEWLEGNPIQTK